MMNMQKMMKQAQELQKNIEAAQKELAAAVFVGASPQDFVRIEMTGDRKVQSVTVNPEVLDKEDPETVQDMIAAALNQVLEEIDKSSQEKLGKYTHGLNLPF